MKRAPQPDKRTLRRETIKQVLSEQDGRITSVEFVTEPIENTDGRCWCDIWLYRVGSGQPAERLEVLVDLQAKQVIRLGHPPMGEKDKGEQ